MKHAFYVPLIALSLITAVCGAEPQEASIQQRKVQAGELLIRIARLAFRMERPGITAEERNRLREEANGIQDSVPGANDFIVAQSVQHLYALLTTQLTFLENALSKTPVLTEALETSIRKALIGFHALDRRVEAPRTLTDRFSKLENDLAAKISATPGYTSAASRLSTNAVEEAFWSETFAKLVKDLDAITTQLNSATGLTPLLMAEGIIRSYFLMSGFLNHRFPTREEMEADLAVGRWRTALLARLNTP